jgi:hypothetical protein
MADLVHAIRVLRDEVLDTVLHGDRDPPGAEVFDAVLRTLAASGDPTSGDPSSGDTIPDLDLALHDAVARRLAWGDGEEVVLADAEAVFDRLLVAALRALRDPADQMVVIETATLVAVTVSRVVALAATARAARERAARLREELAQRQLQEALGEQQVTIAQLEEELKRGF